MRNKIKTNRALLARVSRSLPWVTYAFAASADWFLVLSSSVLIPRALLQFFYIYFTKLIIILEIQLTIKIAKRRSDVSASSWWCQGAQMTPKRRSVFSLIFYSQL